MSRERWDWSQWGCEKVVSGWLILLILWGLAGGICWLWSPSFSEVARQGEFNYLPETVRSRQAESLFQRTFDKNLLRSLLVICVRRTTRAEGLTETTEFAEQDRARKSDYEFIEKDLRPALIHILQTFRLSDVSAVTVVPTEEIPYADAAVTTFSDQLLGPMLISEDQQAALVVVELPSDFLDIRNTYLLQRIENLLYENPEFRSIIPPGLEITLSGMAAVGRDLNLAAEESVTGVVRMALLLLVLLLLATCQAPILALIPLLTVLVVQPVTLGGIATLAARGWLEVFHAMEIYILTTLYGAGICYALFLLARYRQELEKGQTYEQAIARALQKSLRPLAMGMTTAVLGVGMLFFASYGKFRLVGIGIACGLILTGLAVFTLTPALLRLCGKWVFWPNIPEERPGESPGWISRSNLLSRLAELNPSQKIWKQVAGAVLAFPGRLWGICFGLLLPLVLIGWLNFSHLSYGLLADLAEEQRSVVGSEALQQHFQPGNLGPTTILLTNPQQNFLRDPSVLQVKEICDRLYARRAEIGLLDLFSSSYPLGMTARGLARQQTLEAALTQAGPGLQAARRAGIRARVMRQYVGNQLPDGEQTTRLDLVFAHESLQQNSILQLEATLRLLEELIPQVIPGETSIHAMGATASIRDMKQVIDGDQQRIIWLVSGGTFLLLLVFFRNVALAVYLLLVMGFCYYATLGATVIYFGTITTTDFVGLDGKMRLYLFTILMGLGQSLNLFFLARVSEEQQRTNGTKAVRLALAHTGSNLSSAGLSLVAAYAALLVATLMSLQQLGFALAFGFLLATFIVRGILVPSYLILLERGEIRRFLPFLAVPQIRDRS